ncbi:MAG: hypothetical protein ACI9G1_000358, partial [Pirellulaceae bacterium]
MGFSEPTCLPSHLLCSRRLPAEKTYDSEEWVLIMISTDASLSALATESTNDHDFQNSLNRVLKFAQSGVGTDDRRSDVRHPFPYPIRLVPVMRSNLEPIGCEIVGVGKHISPRGFDFYFNEPLPYRWAIAALQTNQHETINVLVNLEWCRFG